MNPESVTLYFREGSADKVYQVVLKESADGWVVNFEYGRRGSTMTPGTKTSGAVPYAKAKGIYNKLVNSKLAKGYTPGKSGVPFQSTNREEKSTGITPQLLNPIDSTELSSFLGNPQFVLQEKFDGRRALIRLLDGEVEGINRSGLVFALPEAIAQAVAGAGVTSLLLDGELLGDGFVAFDLLELEGTNLRERTYESRLALLTSLSGLFGADIRLVETAITAKDKRKLCDSLLAGGREGVVLKDINAPYVAGKPASGGSQRKCKFYATASFVVGTINSQRSVGLCLYSNNKLVAAGNVTIPPNAAVPHSGAVVEIRYLYAFPESGVVYQPVFLQERDDILPEACVVGQLKFKTPRGGETGSAPR
ncbi:MAG: DNA ligase [Verrucomicrobia bacterium]|nr:DNA ligase [Verrucomicrobiota bacterium]